MDLVHTLLEQNARFATERFAPGLKIIPSRKIMLLGCVDPRVDPEALFGLGLGEAAVIRNVGGRVTPDVLATLEMLSVVAQAGGGALGPGWNLIVLHHTDCGITRLTKSTALLSAFFGVPAEQLGALAIEDPRASVQVDIAALRANPKVSAAFTVSGLVYDVATGRVETVVAPQLLRP